MKTHHEVKDVSISNGNLLLTVDGEVCSFQLAKISNQLATASEEELKAFEITPSGYGIHWPLLDEDVSIGGLLGINHSPDQKGQSA